MKKSPVSEILDCPKNDDDFFSWYVNMFKFLFIE